MKTCTYKISTFALTIFCLAGLLSCGRSEGYHSIDGNIWGTTYRINYHGPANLEDSIKAVLEQVDNSLSVFDSLSVVSNINRNKSMVTDSHFEKIYNLSVKIKEQTDGMFDPTLGPLIRAWGFGEGGSEPQGEINPEQFRDRIGIEKTRLVENRLEKENPATEFNFSAIAKGYGCDAIGAMLKRNSVVDFLIEIGGEIVAAGKSPRGDCWKIGVESPGNYLDPSARPEIEDFIILENRAVATSSNLRNRRPVPGKPAGRPHPPRRRPDAPKAGHIFSPKTLMPVESDLLSATVIAQSCAEADALATAAIAAGSEKARRFLAKSDVSAILITADTIYYINKE